MQAGTLAGLLQGVMGVVEDGRWRPGIGDPTPGGWTIFAGYLAAAGLCGWLAWGAWRSEADRRRRRGRTAFWTILTLFMLLLGVNKQLDLQTWLYLSGKAMAQRQGWYESRALLQKLFIVAVAGAGTLTLALLFFLTGRSAPRGWLALLGLVFLGGFIVVRASSFHQVDALLGLRLGGFLHINRLLESLGVALVAAGALYARRDPYGRYAPTTRSGRR
jgi:hypothetical protein